MSFARKMRKNPKISINVDALLLLIAIVILGFSIACKRWGY